MIIFIFIFIIIGSAIGILILDVYQKEYEKSEKELFILNNLHRLNTKIEFINDSEVVKEVFLRDILDNSSSNDKTNSNEVKVEMNDGEMFNVFAKKMIKEAMNFLELEKEEQMDFVKSKNSQTEFNDINIKTVKLTALEKDELVDYITKEVVGDNHV